MSASLEQGASLAKVVLPSGQVVEFEDLDHISVVNGESFGPVTNLGVQDEDGNRTLILRDFAAVLVEV